MYERPEIRSWLGDLEDMRDMEDEFGNILYDEDMNVWREEYMGIFWVPETISGVTLSEEIAQ